MSTFIKYLTQYNNIWLSLFLIIGVGILGNITTAAIALFFIFLITGNNYKPYLLLIVALGVFYLSDNLSPQLSYVNNFRFVILGLGFLYLFNYHIFFANPGNYILPFSLIATILSLFFAPMGGAEAALRGLGFWVVALFIFRITDLAHEISPKATSQIILAWIILFFLFNLILNFSSFLPGILIKGRLSGIMGNPNGLGLLTMIAYPFVDLIRIRKETNIRKKFFPWIKILIFIIAVSTASRNAILSILIYEIVLRISHNALWLISGIFFVAVIWYFLFNIDIISIIHSLGLSEFFRTESLETLSGRTEVWQVAWDEIKESPWLGKGMLYDQHFIREYVEENITGVRERHWSGIWNSYLSLWLDVGIIGLLAFTYFFVKVFQKSQFKQLSLPFIIMVLFSALTESWLAASMNAFFPMFILYWALQFQPIENTFEK